MAVCVVLAFLLDYLLGEPKRLHPLVGFGYCATVIESRLNATTPVEPTKRPVKARLYGACGYLLLVVPVLIVAVCFEYFCKPIEWVYVLGATVTVYLCIGWQSLLRHAEAIYKPLAAGNVDAARQALAMIVSRDTDPLNQNEVAKAATESVLENGADAIFSAVFWFCVLGVPGIVWYRMSNTLDAMWGYKTPRFFNFGWCAARVDDLLNFVPARLCAFSYSILGHCSVALRCWYVQAKQCKSPNAGPVMAAGAGALNLSLGGDASYNGRVQRRPLLGPAPTPYTQADARSIGRACKLVSRCVVLWCAVIICIGWLF